MIGGAELSLSRGNVQLTSPSVKVFVKHVRTRAHTPVLDIPYYYRRHVTDKRLSDWKSLQGPQGHEDADPKFHIRTHLHIPHAQYWQTSKRPVTDHGDDFQILAPEYDFL